MAGLFDGEAELVKTHFGAVSIRRRSAFLNLAKGPPPGFDGTAFIAAFFARVAENWAARRAVLSKPPSRQNWRFSLIPGISPHSASPELRMERAIAQAALTAGRGDLANQVPVASGMAPGENRRALDLLRMSGESGEFIKLKIGSDSPLYALIEVLRYGMLWLLSRRDREALGYAGRAPLDLRELRLIVLAPPEFYRGVDLGWLEAGISAGLAALGAQEGVRLSFGFEALPTGFDARAAYPPQEALAAFDGRRPLL